MAAMVVTSSGHFIFLPALEIHFDLKAIKDSKTEKE
jgi:hypothetical protein